MLISSLVAILALCQVSLAFFMWFPAYRCVEDHTCIASDAKRSREDIAEPAAANSLNLVQRLPQNDLPHEVQIRRLANRLARKYQRGSPIQHFDEGEVAKRDNKYTIVSAIPPTQSNSAGIDQDGTDFSYFAEVSLGTSDTPYHMLLDTGAGQTWVMGDSCTSSPCAIHNTFGPGDSTTYKALDRDFRVAYGTGDVAGVQATDNIGIAGLKVSMTFGVANQTSKDFNNFPIDGILGLNQGKSDFPNFIQTLVSTKALKANLFGVSLNRAKDGTNNGAINFGAIDTSRYTGNIGYTPINTESTSDWAIPVDDLGFGGKKTGISNRLAYVDTGTSFIFSPAEDAKAFHDLIPGSSSDDGVTYYVPCTTTDSAFFTFSGVNYQVSSVDWVGPMVNGRCTSNIYGMPVVGDAWLLGDTFLKNVYAVFDVDQNRIGFGAKKAAPPEASSTITTSSPSGGPNSSSDSIPTSAAGSASAIAGPTSNLESTPNQTPTGSSSGNPDATSTSPSSVSTTNPPASSSASGSPGLNGHQTDSTGTAAAEASGTANASPSPTKSKSSAVRLPSSHILEVFLTAFTLLTLMS